MLAPLVHLSLTKISDPAKHRAHNAWRQLDYVPELMLDPGMGFTIGTEPTRVRPYETCAAQGCFALVTMDADTLKSLNANMGGQVAVAVPNNPQAVAIPFTLRGFAQGYTELQRLKSRRSGIFSFLRG